MAHPSFEPSCAICNKLSSGSQPLFQNELWQVRPIEPACAVPGWVMLITARHVPGPAAFDDRETVSFGPTFRHLQRVLLEVTGALRIYSAAMGESSPHFHCHLVPRYEAMPNEAKGWPVFDLLRASWAGEVPVDLEAAAHTNQAFQKALAEAPPP